MRVGTYREKRSHPALTPPDLSPPHGGVVMLFTRFASAVVLLALLVLASPALAGLSIVADLDSNSTNGPDSTGVNIGDTLLVRIWLTGTDSLYAFGMTFGDTSGAFEWIADTVTAIYVTPSGWADIDVQIDSNGLLLLQSTDFSVSTLLHTPTEIARLRFKAKTGGECPTFVFDQAISGWMDAAVATDTFSSFEGAKACVANQQGGGAAPESGGEDPSVSGGDGDSEDTPLATDPVVQLPERPITIIENRGQLPDEVLYYARSSSGGIFFTSSGVTIDRRTNIEYIGGNEDSADSVRIQGIVVRYDFAGASTTAEIVPSGASAGKYNYLLGDVPSLWITNVPTYKELTYKNLYFGIDVVYRIDGNHLKSELLVAAGADVEDYSLSYEGIDSISAENGGTLILYAAGQKFVEGKPIVFQDGSSSISGNYEVGANDEVGFSVGTYDDTKLLVVDPDLYWSSYLGGSGNDQAFDVAADSSGDLYVTGRNASDSGFPTTPGVYDSLKGSGDWDAFVAKFSRVGNTLIYATFLGNADRDEGRAIEVDKSNRAVVGGWTESNFFPTEGNGYDHSPNTFPDGFIARFSVDGSSLDFSTYHGGNGQETVEAIALDGQDTIYVTGTTTSSAASFPASSGAYDTTPNGGDDAYVSKLLPDGSQKLKHTFLGGGQLDQARGIVLSSSNQPIVVGRTRSNSPNFPTAGGPLSSTLSGDEDAFVSRLSADFTDLSYSTYLGGENADAGWDVALSSSGGIVVCGETESPDFPTINAYNSQIGGNIPPYPYDGFVSEFIADTLIYSTFFGGRGNDYITTVAVSTLGDYVFAGFSQTDSFFPVGGNPIHTVNQGAEDLFFSDLDASTNTLNYSTLVGGSGNERPFGIAVDPWGFVAVAGYTASNNFPLTTGVPDSTYVGHEGIVLVFSVDNVPTSVGNAGFPQDTGPPRPGVSLHAQPTPFNPATTVRFTLTQSAKMDLAIFDVRGRRLITLLSGRKPAGPHSVLWQGNNSRGNPVGSGTYFVVLRTGDDQLSRKIVLLR